MQFLVNKREQIYDDMVIHVNKSSLSYQQICEHYINASDMTPIANGTGDFIIVGARLFLIGLSSLSNLHMSKNLAEKWKLKSMNLSV